MPASPRPCNKSSCNIRSSCCRRTLEGSCASSGAAASYADQRVAELAVSLADLRMSAVAGASSAETLLLRQGSAPAADSHMECLSAASPQAQPPQLPPAVAAARADQPAAGMPPCCPPCMSVRLCILAGVRAGFDHRPEIRPMASDWSQHAANMLYTKPQPIPCT